MFNQNSHNEILQLCNVCFKPLEKARVQYSLKSKCRKCQDDKARESARLRKRMRVKGGNKAWKLLVN